jgi:hypothetical protein
MCSQIPNPESKSKLTFSIFKKNLLHRDRKKGHVSIELQDLKSEDAIINWFLIDTSSSEDKHDMSPRSSSYNGTITSPRTPTTPVRTNSFFTQTSDLKSPRKLNPMMEQLNLNLSAVATAKDTLSFVQLRLQYSASEKGKMRQLHQSTNLEKYKPLQNFLETCPVKHLCVVFNHTDHLPTNKEMTALFQTNPKMDHLAIIKYLIQHEVNMTGMSQFKLFYNCRKF